MSSCCDVAVCLNEFVQADLSSKFKYSDSRALKESSLLHLLLPNREDLAKPNDLQNAERPERNERESQPRLTRQHAWIVLHAQCIPSISAVVKADGRPHEYAADDEQHRKDSTEHHFPHRPRFAQTDGAMLIIKVCQQAKHRRRNFGNSEIEWHVRQCAAGEERAQAREDAKDVVHDEFGPVVPHDGVVQILELVEQEEDAYPEPVRMVRVQSLVECCHWHGLLFQHGRVVNVLQKVLSLVSKVRDDEAAQAVNADVPGENLSVRLAFQNRMIVLHRVKGVPQRHLDADQPDQDERSGRQNRVGRWYLPILAHVRVQGDEQERMLFGRCLRGCRCWAAHVV
mmetsp:Transcript_26807/g.75230  ORF Transcript_26807/g.75230 Transcript_26807/m.75230 type:complete len:341 (-) Transcript_26807:143-1165(-)|eukprot:CAMPEP_0119559050 /NCGR_PEP_ID=MMETSP1352-20130426/11778_1 /TAXON_ID=265584 /ORGANISM="Stauroneis constricta, Strain CCMP1120" /LENGTH=340 /DNA_ID=CAMNT_0007606607 /DNA_START=165 /DNA_END=1187 /DNA_ORIENTATION=-